MSPLGTKYLSHFTAETANARQSASYHLRHWLWYRKPVDILKFERAAERQQLALHREDAARQHAEKL
jgi:hypothetical protein